MNTKFKILALSASVFAGLAATPAHAFVYGESRLIINSLALTFSPAAGSTVTNFQFTTTNTAALNNNIVATTASCYGVPGAPGPSTNNCNPSNPRLNPAAANAPGGSPAANRTSLDFGFKGPLGGLQFSNSASSIDRAEFTLDGPSFTRQIAESELQSGTSASASGLIQSTTGFMFTFTLMAPGSLSLNFSANPDQYTQISELLNGAFSAQSTLSTSFTLQQSGGNQFATWAPRGNAANDCIAVNGLACTETSDSQNLNATVGTTANNTFQQLSHDGDAVFTPFGIVISGLGAGTYTLTLATNTATQLSALAIPEPGTMTLLSTGLAAVGLRAKRRQKKQAA